MKRGGAEVGLEPRVAISVVGDDNHRYFQVSGFRFQVSGFRRECPSSIPSREFCQRQQQFEIRRNARHLTQLFWMGKSEIRISKSETNLKHECSNDPNKGHRPDAQGEFSRFWSRLPSMSDVRYSVTLKNLMSPAPSEAGLKPVNAYRLSDATLDTRHALGGLP